MRGDEGNSPTLASPKSGSGEGPGRNVETMR
jgi:hypothetical protein